LKHDLIHKVAEVAAKARISRRVETTLHVRVMRAASLAYALESQEGLKLYSDALLGEAVAISS